MKIYLCINKNGDWGFHDGNKSYFFSKYAREIIRNTMSWYDILDNWKKEIKSAYNLEAIELEIESITLKEFEKQMPELFL